MSDGSVRFFKNTDNLFAWRSLGTMAGRGHLGRPVPTSSAGALSPDLPTPCHPEATHDNLPPAERITSLLSRSQHRPADAGDAREGQPAGAFVVKPYLQLGPPRPGTHWYCSGMPPTPTPTGRSSIGPGPTAPGRRPKAPLAPRGRGAGIEPHRVYRAALTGLAPGGTFDYRVLKGGEVVFSAEARAPKSADQPYRFVAFGDCGAGTPEQKPLAHRAFLSRPDFVVIPGDIVYEYGLISEYREKFWPVYNADEPSPSGGVPLLRSILFVAAPGNHDTETRDLDKIPGRPRLLLYWDQPLNGPLGKEGGPVRPDARAPEANRKGVHRGRRRRVSADDELLVRLRQRPLDHRRLQPLRRLDRPRR